jgi:hypothetical protein
MNGQQRDSGKQSYSKINMIKSILELKDYRGYKRILFLRPFSNTYLGYLDNQFFGFTVQEGDTKHWLMDIKDAVDHYLDKTFFHNSSLEYNTFMTKPIYKPYVTALKFMRDKSEKKDNDLSRL